MRWEIVVVMTSGALTWVVPFSEGKHYRRTRVFAGIAAYRFTRSLRQSGYDDMVFKVRRGGR
jgi:hypothetical protein